MEREVSASGSIALRAMKSMARLASWSQPKADEKEAKKEKEEGVEKKKSKKSKKEKEAAEKKIKENKGKDGTLKMSTSSFEAGSIGSARSPKVSLEVPSDDRAPKTIGKKQSVLGFGLPSSLRFGTVRSAVSTAASTAVDPEEHPPAGTVRRTSVSSTMSLNILTSRRPSSMASNSSSLRPPSTASGMSRLSSSSASIKWDEEGLETVKEMRRKDREERRRNSTDSNTVLSDAVKKGSRRSAEGRRRPLVSDLFAEVGISNRPTSPEVQSQCSSALSKDGPIVNIETATNDGHGHASDPETLETPMKRARPRPMSEQMLSNVPRPQGIYNNVERKHRSLSKVCPY
jgi:serine/arginine repetitive matrix protein 2